MTSQAIRDPLADHLITPQNAALLLIDYQPSQIAAVHSMDPQLMIKNAVSTVKLARTFKLPIVHSTVNVASGRQKPTVPELVEVLGGPAAIDRTTINSWEDAEFVAAVRALVPADQFEGVLGVVLPSRGRSAVKAAVLLR